MSCGRLVKPAATGRPGRLSSALLRALRKFPARCIVYFRILGMADSASEAYLRKFFQQNAAGGVLTEQPHLDLAPLSWSPVRT